MNSLDQRKLLFIVVFSLLSCVCRGQEWFTNFDVAKRLARIQDKMLFVLWEESFEYSIPVVVRSDDGVMSLIDLSKDTRLDRIIWEYFVPVRLSELEYSNFSKDAKGRGNAYINKLNDDSIKIMDVNGNILNIKEALEDVTDFSFLVSKYALNTSYLKSELDNYAENKNFLTSSLLALKYIDFAIFANEELQPDLIALANIYLNESINLISEIDVDKKDSYIQKLELIRIKEMLILNEPRKAYRKLKKIDESQIDTMNVQLYAFLNYVMFEMLRDDENAIKWKSKISTLDLKKAELILKK